MSSRALDFLPRMQWRGVQYPILERNVSFAHEKVEHKLQYRENDFIETLGPHSWLFKYTIPMREDIASGPYKNLFNEGLPRLVRDMRNKEPGDLIDNVYWTYRCIPVSFSETTDNNKRDGTDVQVEFLYSPLLEDTEPDQNHTVTGLVNLVGESGMLDADLAKQDWNQEPSPEGMTDAISAIAGAGAQGLRQVDKLASALDDVTFKAQKVEEVCDNAENPQNWRIKDSAKQVQYEAVSIKNRISEDPATKIIRMTSRVRTTLSTLARDSGMSLNELLSMNPSLARSPVIPAGTRYVIAKRINLPKSK
jgi:hypothetical protein